MRSDFEEACGVFNWEGPADSSFPHRSHSHKNESPPLAHNHSSLPPALETASIVSHRMGNTRLRLSCLQTPCERQRRKHLFRFHRCKHCIAHWTGPRLQSCNFCIGGSQLLQCHAMNRHALPLKHTAICLCRPFLSSSRKSEQQYISEAFLQFPVYKRRHCAWHVSRPDAL